MTDSPKQTARSSVSSRPTRTKPELAGRRPGIILGLVNLVVLVLGLYLLQEGLAHISQPNIVFFVDFPAWLTYVTAAAVLLTIPNLAIAFLSIRSRLPIRRWTIVTTALALVLIGLVVGMIGPDDVLTIINPNW